MPYTIKDAEMEKVIRQLAQIKGKPILDSILEACLNEIERERRKVPLWDRLLPLLDRVVAPKTGLKADKPFFDDLSGDA
jgi:antitoxin VapB